MCLLPVPSVPYLEALSVRDEKTTGTTRPLAMWCGAIDGGEPEEYVVKLQRSVRLNRRGLARELFAALLGQALGFNIPPVSVVNISPELCQTVRGELASRIHENVGANFGSRVVVPAIIFQFLPEDQLLTAIDIFAFDMLLQNPDRRIIKPNLFQNKAELILFDHEMAFPYADPRMLLGLKLEPWTISRDEPLVTGHVFYRHLKKMNGRNVTFSAFMEKVAALSDEVLSNIAGRVPEDWVSHDPPEIENICNYIRTARDNVGRFERCLLEVLA